MKKVNTHRFAGFIALLVLAFLYLPIISVVVNSVNANDRLLSWGGFTWRWFTEVIFSHSFQAAFLQSLAIAFVVMLVSIILATTVVIGGRESGKKLQTFQDSSMYLRLTLPEVVIVVGILAVVRAIPGINLGPLWVVLAQTIVYSAYATVIIRARFASIAELYEAAAYDLGATTARCLRTVIIPLLAPSILVGALMAFTFSLDAVVSVVFLGGPHTETIPTLILSMIKKGINPDVNAMGVLVMLFNLVVLAIIIKVVGLKQTVAAAGGGEAK